MPKKSKPGGVSAPQTASKNKDAGTLILPPFLYLGPRSATSSSSFLTRPDHVITHILSIGAQPSVPLSPDIIYQYLPLNDSGELDISDTVSAAITFISSAESSKKGKVLVHCSAGISRSPTIIAAYLMKEKGMTLREALGMVINARPAACPRPSFMRQLNALDMEMHNAESLGVLELPRKRETKLALFAETTTTTI